MIAYMYRFHGHGALRYVSKNGTALRSQNMTLKYIHNPRRKTSRFGVVVSKKVLKSAVGRNRIRRRIYEVLRHDIAGMKPGYDIVCFVAHATIRTMPADELKAQLTNMITEADLYKKVTNNDTIV